jgi:adenylate cyclase
MIEIERRFLVAATPDALPTPRRIEQAYLTTEPIAVRVRRVDDQHILTIKGGSGLERLEIERDLDADEFQALWDVGTELRISKRRYRIDLADGAVAELDLYDGDLSGRSIVEVEFPSVEAAERFDPPGWFGTEVTNDVRYSNAELARSGWPALEAG